MNLTHPFMRDTRVTVTAEEADEWIAAGWLADEPLEDDDTPTGPDLDDDAGDHTEGA